MKFVIRQYTAKYVYSNKIQNEYSQLVLWCNNGYIFICESGLVAIIHLYLYSKIIQSEHRIQHSVPKLSNRRYTLKITSIGGRKIVGPIWLLKSYLKGEQSTKIIFPSVVWHIFRTFIMAGCSMCRFSRIPSLESTKSSCHGLE